MTALWTTHDLPGLAFDPEPDDEDGPWCPAHAGLWGQGVPLHRLDTMTPVPVVGEVL